MGTDDSETPRRRAPLRWTAEVGPEVTYILIGQLLAAIESRDLIGQAKGIVMARHRCTAEEAFARLVVESQHRNLRLTAVAAEIVEAVAPAPFPAAV